MRKSKLKKKKGKLMLKNRKDTFCNNPSIQGDTYKKH